jgi:hypothetical protein
MTANFITKLKPMITIENARTYGASSEKFLWVYDLIEQLDMRPTDVRINWVEDRFDELLAQVQS